MSRASLDEYFLRIAAEVASRATCDRLHVGCVIVRDKTIVSTGYNGSARGLDHCDDVGHDMVNDHCVRTNHAEANAIVQAAREGMRTSGATAYVTHLPCWPCFRLLINAGVVRVVYRTPYRGDERIWKAAERLNIPVVLIEASATTDPVRDHVRALIEVGDERTKHLFRGDCPDQGMRDARDPECPACKVLVSAAAALETL